MVYNDIKTIYLDFLPSVLLRLKVGKIVCIQTSHRILRHKYLKIDLLNWMVDSEPIKVYATGGRDFYGGEENAKKRCAECEKANTCNYWINAKRFQLDYGTSLFELPDYCVWSKEMDLDDNAQLLITYASGVKATFQECHFTPDYTREFWFIGTKGKMYGYFDNPGRFLIRIEYSHEAQRRTEEWKPESTGGSHGGGDTALAEDFYTRIIENKKTIEPVKSAYYSTALALCANESIETGLPIDIVQMR